MKTVQIAEPSTEPVTLQEIKEHLRLDSGDFADNLDTTQSITPADQATTTGYGLVGAGVDVLLYETVINLNSGTNGATGTVDVKIQDSDDDITYTDWFSYTQVTTANDNEIYEKEYTGGRRYVRAVAQVLLASCNFSVDVIRRNTQAVDDTLLSSMITQAREYSEGMTWRRFITQTIDLYLDSFSDRIEIPYGNLQSVTHIKYLDTDGTENTLSTDDYIVETNGDGKGAIVKAYNVTYPTSELYPSNPIQIRFVCGYGVASAVPELFKSAIKLLVGGWYGNREGMASQPSTFKDNPSVLRLLNMRRLF
jgi:uncharacterized phiE125 gp8 family phage protein